MRFRVKPGMTSQGGVVYLGNVRVVADEQGTDRQVTHYYPFGSAFMDGKSPGLQPYKYNGKEQDKMHGLNLYDYHARHYDPPLGRFTTIDPLAEKYYNISPYIYVANNPMKFIDPDGKRIGWPQVDPSYYRRVVVNHQINQTIKDNASVMQRNAITKIASMSDINDAVVLGTTLTRGKGALNIDGTSASGLDKGWAALGAILPVVSGSVVKSFFKKIGSVLGIGGDARKTGRNIGDVLESSEILRIENAATRINKPIHVVGSRAAGTAKVNSDWNYVINGINSKEWSKIKNSLPGPKSLIDNTPRNIDLIKLPLDKTKPHITIFPRSK